MLNLALRLVSAKIGGFQFPPEAAVPSAKFEGLEYMLGQIQIYETMPSGLVNADGDKILEDARAGIYNGLGVVCGIVELNLRESDRKQNAKGLLMMYVGGFRSESTSSQTVVKTDRSGFSILLENSIVAASYLDTDGNNYIWAWAQHRISNSPLYKYPQSELEVKKLFEKKAKEHGLQLDPDCKTLSSIPPLVTLAKETYAKISSMD